ncbi:hypothetical protein B0H14DRAFT_3523704 [Mycena olivaceomarginata]|nr:hypothetical protein B0H14DRAFT_3523704 [Mycena olivaceomarginata]
MLVPGAIHSLQRKLIECIFFHGAVAAVTTSQLRTCGETVPISSGTVNRAFAVPAPPDVAAGTEEFFVSNSQDLVQWTEDTGDDFEDNSSLEEENDDENFDFDFDATDEYSWMPFEGEQDIPMDGIQQTFSILNQPETFSTRVLDDAFHYMDRLLRLLSKKHSVFKAFAHDFSEAIFIRDKSDDLACCRTVLLKRLETVFKAYEDIECSTKEGRGPLFSDDAKEMVLLDTVRKRYLSDPPGIPLYYFMGKDRDGLNIYRTIRGTNSTEGGFHMVVRRIFGSMRAYASLP